MTIAEQIYEKVKQLPPETQAKVLDFAEGLAEETGGKRPPLNPPPALAEPVSGLRGLWRDLAFEPISSETIEEARREMWGGFPRDLPE
jgi:hypothetical protein